jgi:hypothetical protein
MKRVGDFKKIADSTEVTHKILRFKLDGDMNNWRLA